MNFFWRERPKGSKMEEGVPPGTPLRSRIRPRSLRLRTVSFSICCFLWTGRILAEKASRVVHPSQYEPRWSANNFSSLEPLFSRVNSRDNRERERERERGSNNDLARPHVRQRPSPQAGPSKKKSGTRRKWLGEILRRTPCRSRRCWMTLRMTVQLFGTSLGAKRAKFVF
jgi:hypothetical protein